VWYLNECVGFKFDIAWNFLFLSTKPATIYDFSTHVLNGVKYGNTKNGYWVAITTYFAFIVLVSVLTM